MNAVSQTTRSCAGAALAGHGAIELLDCDVAEGTAAPPDTAPGDLLLLHGFGGDKHQLRPLGEALCPRGSVAVYPTLRGHGASPKPGFGYSVLDFSADLHRFADAMPEALHLVGYSYGGLVAAVSAVTWAAPRVRSLAVIDQSFAAHPDFHEDDEWAEGSLLRWYYDFSHLLDLLERLGVPVLVLAARDSRNILPDERSRLAARESELFSLAFIDGDHADCYRNTEEMAAVLREFYRRPEIRKG
jgi:pimeloyl-ACP methyl ester carboxylesterase